MKNRRSYNKRKKGILAIILSLCLLFGLMPAVALATNDSESLCICTTQCTNDTANTDCPLCKDNYTSCALSITDDADECICTDNCTEENQNIDCTICSNDYSNCAVKPSNEDDSCMCDTPCTEETQNTDCNVCSNDYSNCAVKSSGEDDTCTCITLCTESNIDDTCPICSSDISLCTLSKNLFKFKTSPKDAVVTVTDANGDEIEKDKYGYFLEDGDYNYTVTAEGYESISGNITSPAESNDSAKIVVHLNKLIANGLLNISDYESLQSAIDNSAESTTITISEDIELSQGIVIPDGKDITFEGGGRLYPAPELASTSNASIITIAEGGKLTINGITVDGCAFDDSRINTLINCNGTLTLNEGTLKNAHTTTSSNSGAVIVSGVNALFEMYGGSIENNSITCTARCGSVFIAVAATFNMYGGSIKNNICSQSALGTEPATAGIMVVSEYSGTPAKSSTTFNMYGGTITNNTTSGSARSAGGGVCLWGPDWSSWNRYARMTMEDGAVISGNETVYGGGGVFVYGLASFDLNGGDIINNTVTDGQGGGICVYDGLKDKGLSDSQILQYSKAYNLGTFSMDSANVSGNTALRGGASGDGGCGGGIYIATPNASLNSGIISGNTSDRQGGGVYIGSTPYVLEMQNTVIKNNTASILGGGLWLCPTGDITSAVTNGSAIYDNSAEPKDDSAGDDIAIVPQGDTHYADLSIRMLGGGEAKWYRDGHVSDSTTILGQPDLSTYGRYEAGISEQVTKIEGNYEGLAVKCIAGEGSKSLAESQAELWITDNSSQRGGGIGSNGGIIIGVIDDEYSLTVTKDWDNTPVDKQVEVTVNLKVGDYVLDGVVLNESNGWTATFEGLPNPASLKNADITVYEKAPDGFKAVYSEAVIDDAAKTISINVTNVPDVTNTGSLSVEKSVTGRGGDKSKKFHFYLTLTLDGEPYKEDLQYSTNSGSDGTISVSSSGEYKFALKDEDKITFTNLPEGIKYKVVEDEEDEGGYDTTYKNASGTIKLDKTIAVTVINNKPGSGGGGDDDDYGNLRITKTVKGDNIDKDEEFMFRVTFTKKNGQESATGYRYKLGSESGTIYSGDKFTLKHGETITIKDIPTGIKYEVEELNADGYIVSADGETGTITLGTTTAEFINTKDEPEEPDEPDTPTDPVDPDDPGTPSDPNEPSEPDIPSEPSNPETPDDSVTPDDPVDNTGKTETTPIPEKVPQTGDISHTGLWLFISILSCVTYFLLNRRPHKRRNR